MTYSEKLRDPRWQKKRLKILERDNWTCQLCNDNKKTLHVHHIIYNNKDPWEIDDGFLIALCEGCHSEDWLTDLWHRMIFNINYKKKDKSLVDLISEFL